MKKVFVRNSPCLKKYKKAGWLIRHIRLKHNRKPFLFEMLPKISFIKTEWRVK